MSDAPPMLVTTETVPGHYIIRVLGYVDGGAEAEGSTEVARVQAMTRLRKSARTRGANAVVGLRWSGSDQSPIVYGTAAVIDAKPEAG